MSTTRNSSPLPLTLIRSKLNSRSRSLSRRASPSCRTKASEGGLRLSASSGSESSRGLFPEDISGLRRGLACSIPRTPFSLPPSIPRTPLAPSPAHLQLPSPRPEMAFPPAPPTRWHSLAAPSAPAPEPSLPDPAALSSDPCDRAPPGDPSQSSGLSAGRSADPGGSGGSPVRPPSLRSRRSLRSPFSPATPPPSPLPLPPPLPPPRSEALGSLESLKPPMESTDPTRDTVRFLARWLESRWCLR
mmetsp:Transcript_30122/g.75490  ORF Transcript_30122/g.75490 Transcript_30122/m.75490 type:complete len:245 (-) Transcript_30122:1525-2259(-)